MKQSFSDDDVSSVVVGLEKVDDAFLDQYPNLKILGSHTTGKDHINFTECERRGIKVVTLKGETEFLEQISSTAEHTIGLLIALMRNYKSALNSPYQDRYSYQGHTLRGKTLLIIGYGRVGRQVGRIAEAFGMKVLYKDKAFNVLSINQLLKSSDVVSCHIPLEGNHGFFTREMFRKMKATALFINTSRSDIVEKGALVDALRNQYIAGAAIDFIDDDELVKFLRISDRLILTPHIGGCTFEDCSLTKEFILKKIQAYGF